MVLANPWAMDIAATSTTLSTNLWNLLPIVFESLVYVFLVWKGNLVAVDIGENYAESVYTHASKGVEHAGGLRRQSIF
jgi:hypothetical protein